MTDYRRIILVGHCGPDMWVLRSAILGILGEVRLEMAQCDDDLRLVGPADVLLVNRVLDGSFRGGRSGLALIRSLHAAPEPPVMLLVSNYADAQAEAEAAGALPGFGKSALGATTTAERLRDAYTRAGDGQAVGG